MNLKICIVGLIATILTFGTPAVQAGDTSIQPQINDVKNAQAQAKVQWTNVCTKDGQVGGGPETDHVSQQPPDDKCIDAANKCLSDCNDNVRALNEKCIALGGRPSGGQCTLDIDKCSCISVLPDCLR